ncbi:phage tail protein [Pseudoalteromonas sp. MMG013]|uniref:Phage tail protein n=1 Tax=Pseudoalteromonas aurantia 208 TaxID=1314867 RepID=A0ABR9EIR0_9GAMM|nr:MULTISPECIES: phage tail protein [Pseudoalteromonas]MBE0370324.1 hypothetical protein [Pseudoalteromonas aurantia 208]MBQ4845291.1 phage tail protein [Pseudoalteromonas sp. MMG005]MBQ4852416.1 phage tail protein [Pseudoalteromonas sp. MMG012]MBQ4863487.1 phage tail protein [Pseudoalteromonas sp. MMG013]
MIQDLGIPLVGYRFAAVIMTAGIPNPIDIFFKEISGLKSARGVERSGNRVSIANTKQARTLVLKRGVLKVPSTVQEGNLVNLNYWDMYMMRNDILITLLNDNNLPLKAWFVQRAFLESWEWDSLDATRNDVLIESMSFSYSDLKSVSIPIP